MKKIFLLLTLLIIQTSCQKKTEKDTHFKDPIARIGILNAKNTINFEGTYKGILPCADCEGIEMMISLNENKTYAVKSQYIGKGNKIFEQRGTFSWNKEGSVVIFDNIENAPNQYAVGKNTITQLDMTGKLINGNLANKYILTKQKNSIEIVETNQLEKPIVNLNNKMEAQTVIKKINPAVGKVTLAETKWKLKILNGKKVKQKGKPIYYLILNSKDGRYSAYAGCNNLAGNYVMPSKFAISFSNSISTMMVCDNMDLERQFSKMLGETDHYELEDNILKLKKGKKEVLATFEPSK